MISIRFLKSTILMAYGLTDNLIIWKDLYFLFLCSVLQCPQCQSVLDSMGFVCSLGKCGVQRILTLAQLWAKASLRACVWPRNARPRWSWCSNSCSKSSWRKLDWWTERRERWRSRHISGRHHFLTITPESLDSFLLKKNLGTFANFSAE